MILVKLARRNILFLSNERSRRNGWATVATELVEGLQNFCDVFQLTQKNDSNNLENNIIDEGWFYNPLKCCRNLKRVLQITSGRKWDVLICAVEPLLPLAVAIKKNLNIPKLILIGHGSHIYFPFVEWPRKWINLSAARSVDYLVVPSQFTAKKVKEWWKGDIEIISWGVNTSIYYPDESTEKEQAFVFVGELKERKGVTTLLRAFKKLLEQFPETCMYFAGHNSIVYKDLAHSLGITERLIFLGALEQPELIQLYRKCLCHVLPSVNTYNSFEGFGLVHLESNACGIPTIGSNATANQEVIEDGFSGYLCEQNDEDSLFQKMSSILSKQEEYKLLCQGALVYARQFSWNLAVEQFHKLILR